MAYAEDCAVIMFNRLWLDAIARCFMFSSLTGDTLSGIMRVGQGGHPRGATKEDGGGGTHIYLILLREVQSHLQ